MSEATQTPTLEQTLNKTDLGHVIFENRSAIIGAIVAVVVAVCGFLFWKQAKHKAALDRSVKVFEFQNKTWSEAKAGKIPVADLIMTFEGLESDIQSAPVMVPVGLEMGKFLYDKGSYAEADKILSKLNTSHMVSNFFVDMQRAVVLEKLDKVGEAIVLLEKLSQQKEGLMPARVSLELGRLNLLKGEKGKAQTQFEYVLSTFPNDEQAKLAKLYLAQLAK